MFEQGLLEAMHLRGIEIVEEALGGGEDCDALVDCIVGHKLAPLEQFDHTPAAIELALGGDIEFRAKLGIVEEEADETIYWLELLIQAGFVEEPLLRDLLDEANQIVAMVVSSINTSRKNR